MDRFSQILFDLGKELQTELFVDQKGICQLNYHDQLHIQLHFDERKEQVMIATFLCEVPPGKYREKLLAQSLIHNNEYPRHGTLGYSERNNQLTIFTYVPAAGLSGIKFMELLKKFAEEGLNWKDSVENGRPLPTEGKSKPDGGLFGIKL